MSGDNVIVLADRKRRGPGYAPGTPPFDPSNPAHVEAWNTICALGRSEARFQAMEQRER